MQSFQWLRRKSVSTLERTHRECTISDDYGEIFRAFGEGGIEYERENDVIPTMTFWTMILENLLSLR